MAVDLRIRDEVNALREELEAMDEEELRARGEEAKVPGFETIPLETLRNELVAHERNRLRAEAYVQPQLGPDPSSGNPGPS
jgi:hypothetical protein